MPFTPYENQTIVMGIGGLDLRRPPELVPPGKYTRLTNVERRLEGAWHGRPGQTLLFTLPVATDIHTLGRLNDAATGTFTRIAGSGTKLYTGVTGLFTEVVNPWGEFSGDPLTFVPLRPPLSSDAWAYLGDSAQMLKVRGTDGLLTQIGLSKAMAIGGRFRIDEFARTPDSSFSAADRTRFSCFGFDIAAGTGGDSPFAQLATEKTKIIDSCETAGWTNNTGTGTGPPTNATDAADFKVGTSSLKLTTNGPAGSRYYQYWAKANTVNLSVFSDTNQTPASDDDVIHLWLKADRPDLVQEIRIYFVISAFDTATVPGSSTTLNTDAFLKAIRPADFTDFYEASIITLSAASAFNANAQTLGRLGALEDDRQGLASLVKQQTEARRAKSLQLAPGRGQWTEQGAVGAALYRGDFRRIGSDQSKSWGDVKGVIILVQLKQGNANIWFDDIFMRGGYGPDTSPIGSTSYDYRWRHYDPRTGVKGNPSDTQSGRFALDPIRQAVTLTPLAYGDADIRQQFFRRGGSLVSNWYLLGTNTSDGGSFTDIYSDDELKAAPFIEIDNDRPVTTVDSAGDAVYEQPLPSIWGPVLDLLMGCGNPYEPGKVHWSKSGEYDHWPVNNNAEVCAPSEELMAGCVFLGQGYVFSRRRMFNCFVNLAGGGVVTPTPSPCLHGLVSRSGLTVTLDGIYFTSNDGIYKTSGGVEVCITDEDLYPLFHGESAHGYLPVDFTQPQAMRLEAHQNELWFLYRDTAGDNKILVYSILYQYWRFYDFGREVSSLCSEKENAQNSLMILGGRASNYGYLHAGFTDDGVPITGQFRTGVLNQGRHRAEKLYGDLVIDREDNGAIITVTPYAENEQTALQAQALAPTAGRVTTILDLADASANPGPYLAKDLAIDVSWSTSSAAPVFYTLDLSYITQPDEVANRASEWDNAGTPSDKWVKGAILDIDTGGVAKSFTVEADNLGTATTFSVTTTGRQVVELAWVKFRGRLLRLRPTGAAHFKLYSLRWIHDEEPYALNRWESQEMNYGVDAPGGFSLLYAHVSICSSSEVALQVVVTRADGSLHTLTPTPLASTGDQKQRIFVPFVANKGVFSRWIFTSETAFRLYREESDVAVQPWGGSMATVKPFGNDDLDPVRGMVSSESASARSGSSGSSNGR